MRNACFLDSCIVYPALCGLPSVTTSFGFSSRQLCHQVILLFGLAILAISSCPILYEPPSPLFLHPSLDKKGSLEGLASEKKGAPKRLSLRFGKDKGVGICFHDPPFLSSACIVVNHQHPPSVYHIRVYSLSVALLPCSWISVHSKDL